MPFPIITLYLTVALAVAVLVILLPVRVSLHYRYSEGDGNLHIEYSVLRGLLVRRINPPQGREADDRLTDVLKAVKEFGAGFTGKGTLNNMIDKKDAQKSRFTYLLDKAEVEKIEWHTDIGMEDAAETGLLAGLIWMLKGVIVSHLRNKDGHIRANKVAVVPHYDCARLTTDVNCIFTLRFGHIMLAGLKKHTGPEGSE